MVMDSLRPASVMHVGAPDVVRKYRLVIDSLRPASDGASDAGEKSGGESGVFIIVLVYFTQGWNVYGTYVKVWNGT